MAYICFGDSITAGRPGFSYCDYLKKEDSCKNLGLGGDTVIGLITRVSKQQELLPTDAIIIEIGVNDILLPFLETYSESWSKQIQKIYKRGSIPCENGKEFAKHFNFLINQFKSTNISVISIPCIGEDLNSALNKKADYYNNIILEICNKNSITFIDFNGWQKEQINQDREINSYFLEKDASLVMFDTLLTTYMRVSQCISKRRNLLTTIDGVHLNKESSRILAKMILEKQTDELSKDNDTRI